MAKRLYSDQADSVQTAALNLPSYQTNKVYDFLHALHEVGISKGTLFRLAERHGSQKLPKIVTILSKYGLVCSGPILFSDEILISQDEFDGWTKDAQGSDAHERILLLVTEYLQNANSAPA